MTSLLRLLHFLSVIVVCAHCSRVCYNEPDDVDRVTARATVRINGWPGILISGKLVYTSAYNVFYKEGAPELFVTLSSNSNIKVKVKEVYIPTEYEIVVAPENINGPIPESTFCDNEHSETCIPECLVPQDGLFSPQHTRDHALLLLEDAVPLCEQEGDAVAARMDSKLDGTINEDDSEECFYADTTGDFPKNTFQINVLKSVSQYESPRFPHCSAPMLTLTPEELPNYKDEVTGQVMKGSGQPVQCITRGGKQLHVGELDNYIDSQSKCSAFLEKYPNNSVREKYLKEE